MLPNAFASCVCMWISLKWEMYANNSLGCLIEQLIRAAKHGAGTILYHQALSTSIKNINSKALMCRIKVLSLCEETYFSKGSRKNMFYDIFESV